MLGCLRGPGCEKRVGEPVGYKETWCGAGTEGIWGLVGSSSLMRHCRLNTRERKSRARVSASHLQTFCCFARWEQQQWSTLHFTLRFWWLGFQPCHSCPAGVVGLSKVCDCSGGFFRRTEFFTSSSPPHQFYLSLSPPASTSRPLLLPASKISQAVALAYLETSRGTIFCFFYLKGKKKKHFWSILLVMHYLFLSSEEFLGSKILDMFALIFWSFFL